MSDAGTCCPSGDTIKQASQSPGPLPSMFEQHIITDQERRAHSEGKIAISLNYKAGYDPFLSLTSKPYAGLLGWFGWKYNFCSGKRIATMVACVIMHEPQNVIKVWSKSFCLDSVLLKIPFLLFYNLKYFRLSKQI